MSFKIMECGPKFIHKSERGTKIPSNKNHSTPSPQVINDPFLRELFNFEYCDHYKNSNFGFWSQSLQSNLPDSCAIHVRKWFIAGFLFRP